MRTLQTVGVVVSISIAAVLIYQVLLKDKNLPKTAQLNPSANTETDSVEQSTSPEVATLSDADNSTPLVVDSPQQGLDAEPVDSSSNTQLPSYPPLAAYDIGNEPLTDEDLVDLVNRLNNDPVLLAELINELRAESDPERLKRLIFILGSTANSTVVPAAEEMIYSGIPSSRDAGLDLLSRLAPNNPEALAIASNLLVSETEPDILIATMNVMAQPANATPELRESLVTQITPLSSHESASVRRISVSILSRLSNDPAMAPIFYNALFDAEPSVRNSSVYAYASFPYHSTETSQKLLEMVEDEHEDIGVRRGASLALSKNSPDELTKSRIEAAKLAMRQQARKDRQNGN